MLFLVTAESLSILRCRMIFGCYRLSCFSSVISLILLIPELASQFENGVVIEVGCKFC